MRRLFVIFLLIPFIGISQVKNVVNATRVFAKPDKITEFEKALTAHAQKYHTGDWKWRVFQIDSGPDFGGYNITEGPNSWDQLDTRGDISAEHKLDWEKNVSPLTTGVGSSTYLVYREELSSVALTDFTDKIAITHIFPKGGSSLKVEDMLKKIKKVWEAGTQTVAVYEASSSGEPQFILVNRYKTGLKERDANFRKPMMERFNTLNGAGSYSSYLDAIRDNVDHSWGELLSYRADLSSK